MRAPILLLVLGLLGATSALRAQTAFADPDFGFKMSLPDGLHEVTASERAMVMKTTEEAARNVPRAEAGEGARLTHRYIWVDRSSPYNRQMDVTLVDGPPPYLKPEELVEAFSRSGLKVDVTEPVKAPVGGLRIEGSFVNQSGVPMRKTVVYVPDRAKYAMVNLQSFAGDWAIVQPEFLQSILSIRLDKATPPAGAVDGPATGKGGKARAGPGGGKGPQSAAENAAGKPIDWLSLPITGSLVLAALLLAHLLLGARGAR